MKKLASFLHPQKPRAPRTLNLDTPAFSKLNALFNSDHQVQRMRADSTTNTFLTAVAIAADNENPKVTLNAITNTCPPLAQWLEVILKKEPYTTSEKLYLAAKTIWTHCCKPSLLIVSDVNHEMYMPTASMEINRFDIKGNVVFIKGTPYLFGLREVENEETGDTQFEIKECFTHADLDGVQPIDLTLLDELYPGVAKRLEIAQELGLLTKELTQFALCAPGTEQINQTLYLPETF